jgi:hypothetical protein
MLELGGLLLAHRPQPPAFGSPHFVHRLIQVRRDMESVQHMQRLPDSGRQHLQVRFPHVAAHKPQAADQFRSPNP